MIVVDIILPKLGLSKKTDNDLLGFAGHIEMQLTLNAAKFPAMSPSLPTLTTDKTAYQLALEKIKSGNPGDTFAKNQQRKKLENTLILIAQSCANISNGDPSVFLTSGFEIKSKPTPATGIASPKNFSVVLGPIAGTLMVNFKRVKHAYSYEISYGLSTASPETWTNMVVTTAGKVMISELQSNIQYSLHVRGVGGRGKKGEWSEMLTKKSY